MTAYQKLKDRMKLSSELRKVSELLAWDSDVMMPPKAIEERGAITAALAAVRHEKNTDPQIGEWIKSAEQEVQTDWDKRNLQLIKEDYLLSTEMPAKLVNQITLAVTKTDDVWQNAKAKSDWKTVLPELEHLFKLVKEQSTIFSNVLGRSAYDSQLYLYSPGNSQAVIDPLFSQLQKQLPSLVQEIVEKQKSFAPIKSFDVPVEVQEKLVRGIIQKVGYSFERGRMDRATHPASYGSKHDARITTWYPEGMPLSSAYAGLHETGHALYTQHLPEEWESQPVGGDSDMSIHESQSLMMERQVGLSDEFVEYLYETYAQNVSGDFTDFNNFKNTLRKVKPSFIRVEADEVTYPLHIVLRYEIEKALFNGDIKVADIPHIWNEKTKDYFGLDVKEDRLGCMQDVHWYSGLFGYFPAYTQGAVFAAQLFHKAKTDLVDLPKEFRSGNANSLNKWLNENIHSQGQRYDAPDLIERATGEKPNAQYFLDHLRNRYL